MGRSIWTILEKRIIFFARMEVSFWLLERDQSASICPILDNRSVSIWLILENRSVSIWLILENRSVSIWLLERVILEKARAIN